MTDKDSVFNRNVLQPNIEGSEELFENLAKKLSEDNRQRIADIVIEGFRKDEESLSEVFEIQGKVNDLLDMKGAGKPNNSPFAGSANIKSSFLNTLVNQAKATLSRDLLTAKDLVSPIMLSGDKNVIRKAKKVALHQNFQYNYQFNFRKSFRELIETTVRHGYGIRKIFWDANRNILRSGTVILDDFIFNRSSRSLEDSERYTHRLKLTMNDLLIRQEQDIYIHVDDLDPLISDGGKESLRDRSERNMGVSDITRDHTTQREVIESHVFLALHKSDRILRPFIATVDLQDRVLLRLIRREVGDQQIIWFQSYQWDPRIDSIIGTGIGNLLYTTAAQINGILNFYSNSARLSSTRGGFIAKGSAQSGNVEFRNGFYKEVNSRTGDLRQSIMTVDFAPPGADLLNVLQEIKQESRATISHSAMKEGNPIRPNTERQTFGEVQLINEESKTLQSYVESGFLDNMSSEFERYRLASSLYVDEMNFETGGFPSIAVRGPDGEFFEDFVKVDDLSGKSTANGYKLTANRNFASQEQVAEKLNTLSQIVQTDPVLANNLEVKKLMTERVLDLLQVDDELMGTFMGSYDAALESQAAQAQAAPQMLQNQQDKEFIQQAQELQGAQQ